MNAPQTEVAAANTGTFWPGSHPFTHVAERMNDGMLAVDRDGRITYANPAICRQLGRALAQLVGRPLESVLTDEGLREYSSRQPSRRAGSTDPYVITFRHADGHAIERLASPAPLHSEDGSFAGSLAIITGHGHDHGDAEAALARRVIDSSESILYRAGAGPGLPIDYVSENIGLLGHSARELAATRASWLEVVHPHDRRRILAEAQSHLEAGQHQFRRQYRLLASDGSERWFDDESIIWYRADGSPQWIEGLLRDVTALHEAQEATRHALAQTVALVGSVVDKRDPYTGMHQHRVADLALAIGRRLGLHGTQLQGLYLAALLHDIGKVAIPSELLSRPGRLSPEELALVRTHVGVGIELISGPEFPWPLAQVIGQHHERLDGSGYPNGLKGDALMLEARVVAVADVFEAMASHRPYRPSLGCGAALAELRRHRGTRYCPLCVDACAAIAEAHGNDVGALWDQLAEERLGNLTTQQLALDLAAFNA